MKNEDIEQRLALINNRLEKIEREYRNLIASINSIDGSFGGIISSNSNTDTTNLKGIMDLKTRLVRIERKLERYGERIERLEKMML